MAKSSHDRGIRQRLGEAIGVLRGRLSFQGARSRRIDPDWNPKQVGINALVDTDRNILVARTRWLSHSDPYIKGAERTIINNTVGTGIYPIPKTPWPEVNQQLTDLVAKAAQAVDAGREMTLLQAEQLLVCELFNTGEGFVAFPNVTAWRGFAAGPSIEVAASERLEVGFSVPLDGGGKIRQGVEFDAQGRRVAYHVLKDTPRDGGSFGGSGFMTATLGSANVRRIAATDANLIFRPIMAGQIRGVPWPVAAIEAIRSLGAFNEAYLDLARVAACVSVWVTGTANPFKVNSDGTSTLSDAGGNPISELATGMVGVLPAGADVKIASPNLPPPGMEMVQRITLRAIAAALGVSYSRLARDYSQTTFSAARAEAIEDRIGYQPIQELVWTGMAHPWYMRMVPHWLAAGKLTLTPEQTAIVRKDMDQLMRCEAGYPGNQWISPREEAVATQLELQMGITSIKGVCSEKGRQWQRVVDDILEVEKYTRDRRAQMGLPAPTPITSMVINEAPQTPEQPAANPTDQPGDQPADQPVNQPAAAAARSVA